MPSGSPGPQNLEAAVGLEYVVAAELGVQGRRPGQMAIGDHHQLTARIQKVPCITEQARAEVRTLTVVEVERSIQTRTRVTATPTNDEGEALAGRSVQRTEGIFLDGIRLQRIPSFLDGFEGSLRLMSQMWSGLLLALGAALPFAVVLGVLWIGVRAILARRPERVGLKATTLERLGALGREEGAACQAVALLARVGGERDED